MRRWQFSVKKLFCWPLFKWNYKSKYHPLFRRSQLFHSHIKGTKQRQRSKMSWVPENNVRRVVRYSEVAAPKWDGRHSFHCLSPKKSSILVDLADWNSSLPNVWSVKVWNSSPNLWAGFLETQLKTWTMLNIACRSLYWWPFFLVQVAMLPGVEILRGLSMTPCRWTASSHATCLDPSCLTTDAQISIYTLEN